MSDFLKQFEESSYKAEREEVTVDKSVDTAEVCAGKAETAGTSDVKKDNTPTPARSKSKQKIATTSHTVVRDDKHHKRKIVRYATIAGSVLALCLLAFGIFYLSNRVVVKDFVGNPVTEARTWGLSNRITIEAAEEFNLEYDDGMVISQDKEIDSSLQKGSVLRLTVSKGPDPDERIELPDFSTMTTSEVRTWRSDIKALNANVNEEYSDTVDKNHFIRLEFTGSDIDETNYTRADGLLIYMSKGKEVLQANITVPNFIEKSKQEVEDWAKEQGIELTVVELASDEITEGNIIAQSIEAGSRIAKDSDFVITVSLGKFVTVPNFNNLSVEEAGAIQGLSVDIRRRFSTTVAFGRVISQSESAGTELAADSIQVRVVYSLGRPYLDNLVGESENKLAEYFYNFTSQGADIKYRINYIDSSEPRGTIVKMSKYAQFLGLKDSIRIDVSKGNRAVPVPPAEESTPDVQSP